MWVRPKNAKEFYKRKSIIIAIMWIVALSLIVSSVAYPLLSSFSINTNELLDYDKQVDSYLIIAMSYADTPEQIINALSTAKANMIEFGIEPEDYCNVFDWEQRPNTRMSFVYDYIDEMISRAHYIIEWRESSLSNETDVLDDVYDTMVDNYQDELSGNVLNRARDAYIIKYHTWIWWTGFQYVAIWILTVVSIIIMLIITDIYTFRYWDDYARKHGLDRY